MVDVALIFAIFNDLSYIKYSKYTYKNLGDEHKYGWHKCKMYCNTITQVNVTLDISCCKYF